MQNLWVILIMIVSAIALIAFLYQFLKRDGAKESLFMRVIMFVPNIIGNLFHALTMDEKGYSLRKILACVAVGAGCYVTKTQGSAQNAILMLLIWLIFAGILVGIYSIGDIAGAIKTAKSSSNEPVNKSTDTPAA